MSRSPLSRFVPAPENLWLRFVPRAWPTPRRPWLDLSTRTLGATVDGEAPAIADSDPKGLPDLGAEPLDDILYLPPVSAELEAERDALVAAHAAHGTPILVQFTLGGRVIERDGVVRVCDLTSCLLAGDLERIAEIPRGAGALFPLLPGFSATESEWAVAAERLRHAEAPWVHLVAPRLTPIDQRRLAAGDDERFEAIFHRELPDEALERRAAQVFARAGVVPRVARPLPRPPILLRENRRLAGVLAEIADLWSRLDRPAAEGAALFRAARWVDETRIDLAALAREGNLSLLAHLGARSLDALAEATETEEPSLLRELVAEYRGSRSVNSDVIRRA